MPDRDRNGERQKVRDGLSFFTGMNVKEVNIRVVEVNL